MEFTLPDMLYLFYGMCFQQTLQFLYSTLRKRPQGSVMEKFPSQQAILCTCRFILVLNDRTVRADIVEILNGHYPVVKNRITTNEKHEI